MTRLPHPSITYFAIAAVAIGASVTLLITFRVPSTRVANTPRLTLPTATLASLRARGASLILPTGLAPSGTLSYYSNGSSWTTLPSSVAAARGPSHIDGVAVSLSGAASAIYTTSQVQNYSVFGVSAWIKVLSSFRGPEAIVSTRPGSSGSVGITLSLGDPGLSGACVLGFAVDGPNTWIGRASDQSLCSGKWTYVGAVWTSTPGRPVNADQFTLYIGGKLAPSTAYVYPGSRAVMSPIVGNGFVAVGTNAGGWLSPDSFSFTDLTTYAALTASDVQAISTPCCRA